MIDIRTHIFSIIAVFLALGVGIMIGVTVAPGTQDKITAGLANQKILIDNVLAEHNHDKTDIKNLESATSTIATDLTAGKLAGKNVAIVRVGDYSDDIGPITDAITAAGGTLVSTTTISQRIQTLTADEATRVRGELTSEAVSTNVVADLLHPLVKALAQGAATDSDADTGLRVLTGQRFMQTSGDYTKPSDMVLILGGYATGPDDPNAPVIGTEGDLAGLLKTRNVVTVGCEPEVSVSSSIASFQKAGISTVDCIDHAIGRLDAIDALAGESGDYGWKPTASRLLPLSLDNSQPAMHTGSHHQR